MRSAESTARRSFSVMMLGAVVLVAIILEPIAGALFVGMALAAALWPLQRRLSARLHHRPRLSAGLLVFGVVAVFVGPLIGLSAFAVKEADDGVRFVSEAVSSPGFNHLLDSLPGPLRNAAQSLVDRFTDQPGTDVGEAVSQQVARRGESAAAAVGALVSATGSFFFQTTMMLIALFFLLVYGRECVAFVDRVSPLRRGQTRELLFEFEKVSYSVIVSSLITALVQALAALVGYFIARVPHPVFFGAITFFTALVPAIGAASVCLAAGLLLLITGHEYSALFLVIWGLLIVGLIDNVVKPLLIRGGMEMHEAVVFFSLVGGLAALGLPGLLFGPLAVTFFLALLRIYERDFRSPRDKPDNPPAKRDDDRSHV